MKITREKHLSYMTRLMPILLIALLIQSFLYFKWAPAEIALDVSIFVAIGLVMIAAAFTLYDHIHYVRLHRNYLHIGIDWFNYQEEILYRNIVDYEVEVTRHAYYNMTLYLRDGRELKLYYLDDVQELKHFIKNAS